MKRRVVTVLLAVCRVIDARAVVRKRASQAGLQELLHVKIFASSLTESPFSRSPTVVVLSWLFFRPPNYHPPVLILLFYSLVSYTPLEENFHEEKYRKEGTSIRDFSFFLRFNKKFRLQYQIFWFFKNEIMYGINRINFGKDFWKFFGNFGISRGTVEFNFRLYEIDDRFYHDSASKL